LLKGRQFQPNLSSFRLCAFPGNHGPFLSLISSLRLQTRAFHPLVNSSSRV
jgi:hypothetical protein